MDRLTSAAIAFAITAVIIALVMFLCAAVLHIEAGLWLLLLCLALPAAANIGWWFPQLFRKFDEFI